MYGIWKNIQLNIRMAFQIVRKFPGLPQKVVGNHNMCEQF